MNELRSLPVLLVLLPSVAASGAPEAGIPFEIAREGKPSCSIVIADSPRPAARYYVTRATWIAGGIKRLLPVSIVDAVAARL